MEQIRTINQQSNLSLQSIAGYAEEKAEAVKIINLFKNYDELKRLGVAIPKGLILSGMPGVGKTLMANVIQAEANVPFYECKLSDDYDGNIAKKVKELYKVAKENAPSIVFIDELDSLIPSYDYVSDFSQAITSALLTEIDGLSNSEGVLTIATTNKYNDLPRQLLRSGRMDKHIEFDLPDVDARTAILDLYCKDKEMLTDINTREIALKTAYFTGADLKTLINETLLQAITSGKRSVSNEDFYEQIPLIAFKGIRKDDKQKPSDVVCYHELGHFICEYVLNGIVSEVSIETIGNLKGHNRIIFMDLQTVKSYDDCKNEAITCLGGYAAEKVFVGQTFTSVSMDFKRFEATIHTMAISGMLGSEFIFGSSAYDDRQFNTSNDVKVKYFDEYLSIATKIIEDNKELIQFLFDKLLEAKRLSSDEIKEYIKEFNNR